MEPKNTTLPDIPVVGRYTIAGAPNLTGGNTLRFQFSVRDEEAVAGGLDIFVDLNTEDRTGKVFVSWKTENGPACEDWTGVCSCSVDEQIALIRNLHLKR